MKHSLEEMEAEDKTLRFHPKNILLVLIIAGMSMLFGAICVAYLYARVQYRIPPIQTPLLFVFNTLFLILGSWSLNKAKMYFYQDKTEQYKKTLWVCLIVTLLFVGFQYVAWKQLFIANIYLHTANASYIYALSGLHALHVLGGLPFLVVFIIKTVNRLRDPISVLVYFADPMKRLSLKTLTLYWNFVDILWIFLVVFLFVMQWVFR